MWHTRSTLAYVSHSEWARTGIAVGRECENVMVRNFRASL